MMRGGRSLRDGFDHSQLTSPVGSDDDEPSSRSPEASLEETPAAKESRGRNASVKKTSTGHKNDTPVDVMDVEAA